MGLTKEFSHAKADTDHWSHTFGMTLLNPQSIPILPPILQEGNVADSCMYVWNITLIKLLSVIWWNHILMFSCSDWLLHGGSCVSIEMLIWGTDRTENIAILLF